MASPIPISPGIQPAVEVGKLTVREVQGRLRDRSVEIIKEIVTDSTNREGYREDHKLLQKGIFYPNEYFDALTENNETPRLDYFGKRDSFFHGFVSPKFFKMVPDDKSPSGKKIACFMLEDGVLPSEGLKAMREGITLLGCAEVCQIAQYAAIEDVLGTSKFNALFASTSSTPLMIGSALPNNPISRLRVYLMQENPSTSEIKKGDLVFTKNAASYYSKHLLGIAGGYNTICVDDTAGSQRFTTLGLDPNGLTHDQLQDTLIADYNSSSRRLESFSDKTRQAYLTSIGEKGISLAEELKTTQLSSQEFTEQGGGKATIVCELDAKRITDLANSTLENARRLLDSYNVRKGNRVSAE